ncbi:thiolase family protein [Bradyrhizobium sp. U87765 SZCCT0131]|uniref:thiolase family protein n=1 Tax=unclassified Bradyrhizobium TaxID=2631580 RepID=UPI001BA9A9C2|nr:MULTISPECIES: thiolase family protein [unclassified Bradyrhizobium]MBR1218398.1 thiolase family protein [Bradyrhizobium sp. U87765 SZCCT0131]MBR1260656.1 thiolase family protein [Bradyrhizobium sp. U87765 SZCCT0134]MBR1303896.1 thiolase family protein [Bradyrhizobium sp. U87765 SZCCT0110]MBR1319502.1 thiolase family protein [Bradyrhizobium sp. U87765 SZCCT0109]MBR1347827.1 thiolase family protein [Bradyrhizobium sp. U87765 SZCCT0048]
MSFITGVGLTPFGRHEGRATLDLMSAAAEAALADAGLARADIDGVLCGYSTTMPHLMLATVFAEHFGLQPHYAHGIQVGGATGLAMAMLAHELVAAGRLRHVLVVAGENRLTGVSRDGAMQTLAQVGHPVYEVPLGPTIPAYYGLLASRYMHDFGVTEEDFAAFAVLMRRHALAHPGAQFREPITVADVMASRVIATPLKLLDCCPVSDGGAAVVISAAPTAAHAVQVRGCGQAHQHQHVSALADISQVGAAAASARARQQAGIAASDVRYAAVYDSFTVTLALLLEELGFAGRGEAAARARAGDFSCTGRLPLNTHGGLLSYGHCGCGGAMAHLVETQLQMTGRADERQVRDASLAFVHGDGGVMSSHVSMVLERTR